MAHMPLTEARPNTVSLTARGCSTRVAIIAVAKQPNRHATTATARTFSHSFADIPQHYHENRGKTMKALLACAAMLCVSASNPFPRYIDATQIGIAPSAEIVRVDCLAGRGTAFRVSPHILLSVNHVTSLDGCFINGKPFTVLSHSGDFSIIRSAETASKWLHVDCGGYIKGREYHAFGYARGLDTMTEVDLTATGETDHGFSTLRNVWTVVPGQSGGPIVDGDTGAVVGTVNVYDMERGLSGSVELRGTPVCRSS